LETAGCPNNIRQHNYLYPLDLYQQQMIVQL
jgi:hypothetical protein